jgi:glycogen operon protein
MLAGHDGTTDARDDPLLVIMNAHHEPVTYRLPAAPSVDRWDGVVDTSRETGIADPAPRAPGATLAVEPRSMLVLTGRRGGTPG